MMLRASMLLSLLIGCAAAQPPHDLDAFTYRGHTIVRAASADPGTVAVAIDGDTRFMTSRAAGVWTPALPYQLFATWQDAARTIVDMRLFVSPDPLGQSRQAASPVLAR
ncbi:MAG: hypothetical protein ABI551_25065 [Polyangiaceae bacterium]